ncbi:TetR/AcrR family transcriptional regulator [Shimia sagamensis]|uniref:Transcriptional regulator, TetR family n=1 Tax=Shimia sagamensis TaxID=1566352 RepID=A0ABY1PEA9_9RHOB|nr:TetR/AcrR family transcriptional regulator [Shimia sagamensis]SMP32323.1 transcriptional regulator, TetR family [Shimia sagamensis]
MARTIAKDHEQKRVHILKSAARVFAEQGYDRASMSVLAKECGISKANIYHYYDSKDALLFDVLDSYLKDLRNRICEIDLSGLGAKAQLRMVVREILFAYQGADYEHRVQSTAMQALPEQQQKVLRGYQRDLVNQVSKVVAASAESVFDDDPVRLRETTMSVFGMLNWYYMWQHGADTEARERYAELATNLVLGGVRGLA